jgi:hypothetical protein
MKVKIFIPAEFTIPDGALPGLARRCRARGAYYLGRGSGVDVFALVEQARLDGLLDIPEDYTMDADEEGLFIRGRLTTVHAEMRRRHNAVMRRKKVSRK